MLVFAKARSNFVTLEGIIGATIIPDWLNVFSIVVVVDGIFGSEPCADQILFTFDQFQIGLVKQGRGFG